MPGGRMANNSEMANRNTGTEHPVYNGVRWYHHPAEGNRVGVWQGEAGHGTKVAAEKEGSAARPSNATGVVG